LVNKFLVPPGFKDNIDFDAFVEHQFKNLIIDSFRENGFSLIKTPLIEYSKNLDSNTLLLKKNKKIENLSIRNDITPQVIRITSSRLSKKKRPLKLCYYGEVVRKKGSILRPERQFQQVGAEIIGSDSYKADVEIISLAYQALQNIGIKHITIEISIPTLLDRLLNNIKQTEVRNQIQRFISFKDLNNCLDLLQNKDVKDILKILYSCSGQVKNNNLKISKFIDKLSDKNEIINLNKIIRQIKVSKNDTLNVDFFDNKKDKKYYQGMKFTFFAKGVRGEIAGGGRYKLNYQNNTEEAIGYTCYMDTIVRASSLKNKNKKILVPFNINLKNKKLLIRKGYTLFKTFDDNTHLKLQSIKLGIKYYLSNKVVKKI
tara:strand:+ start:2296 stop:3411 length:1116 start_codon:yes stop_codon:yes gene_type:complete